MKKSIYVFAMSLLLFACSKENEIIVAESNSQLEDDYNLNTAIDEKYDGDIFKFEDENDFIKFYEELSKIGDEEFSDFLLLKADNNSSFYRDLSIESDEELLDEEGLDMSAVEIQDVSSLMVSEYLSTIFNYDNQIMIGDNLVHLSKEGLFSIVEKKSNLDDKSNQVFGSLRNTSLTNKTYYAKSWTKYQNNRRATYTIFDETIYLYGGIQSSGIYYRVKREYKSCSFWRCKWKNDSSTATLSFGTNSTGDNGRTTYYSCRYKPAYSSNYYRPISTNNSTYTAKLFTHNYYSVCGANIYFKATFKCKFSGSNYDQTFSDLTYSRTF